MRVSGEQNAEKGAEKRKDRWKAMYSEKITVGAGTQYPLDGMLALPDQFPLPVPAVVMVHGSGPSNMDEKVGKLTPFKDLAEGLQKRGIASLRYHKRTFSYGRKMVKQEATIREETIEDACFALDLLKSDPRIDSSKIFILGHSMGAMLAPRIDAEWGYAKGLIMMAGSPCRMEEIMLRQLKQGESGNPVLKWILEMQSQKFARKFDKLYEMSDEEARKQKFPGGVSLYYFKEMGKRTAADYLLENRKPVLIMQGGKDFQALRDVDFVQFQEVLKGKNNVEYREYPQLNHVFVEAIYDDILKASGEYRVERHIGDEVLDDIAEFILR